MTVDPQWTRPVLAFGRSNPTTASAASAGATTLTLADASAYVVGNLVFVSESDDTETEHLGAVTKKVGLVITIQYPLVAAKSASAKVWQPTLYWRAQSPQGGMPGKVRDDGIEQIEMRDGGLFRTRLRDTSIAVRLSYPRLKPDDWQSLRDFYDAPSGLDSGLYDPVLAFFDHEDNARVVWQVKIDGQLNDYTEISGLAQASLLMRYLADGYPA